MRKLRTTALIFAATLTIVACVACESNPVASSVYTNAISVDTECRKGDVSQKKAAEDLHPDFTKFEDIMAHNPDSIEAKRFKNHVVILKWADVRDESGYVVERRNESESLTTGSGFEWTEIALLHEEACTFVDERAPIGSCSYRVCAISETGSKHCSEAVFVEGAK